jgi:predicted Zn-dependent protease
MFIQTVATAVNGNEVHRKRSPWAGRIGGTVASAGVTVRDRPRLPKGLASCLTDDEGSATRDRTLVSAGVLRGYVADYERARLLTTEAGNGFRRCASTLEGAYTRPAVVEISNLVVEPGVKTLEDLIGEVGHGVYVEKFAAPEVNPNSGAFACEVRNATIIEKGELKDHVKYALLSGNFYEGLKNVDGIGRDPRPMHGFYGQPGCAYVPPMAFSGFELVGQT